MDRQNWFLIVLALATASDMSTTYLDVVVKGFKETNPVVAWMIGFSPFMVLAYFILWVGVFFITADWLEELDMKVHWEVLALMASLSFLYGAVNNLTIFFFSG